MNGPTLTIEVDDAAGTDRLGRRLGAALRRGDVVALVGPLGAGKTTLVRSIAAGAGVPDPRVVNSPTFVLVNEYRADNAGETLRIYHADSYRLRHGGDLEALGFDEMCALGVVLVEWADRVEEVLPPDRLTVRIEPLGPTSRRFRLEASGAAGRLLHALKAIATDP